MKTLLALLASDDGLIMKKKREHFSNPAKFFLSKFHKILIKNLSHFACFARMLVEEKSMEVSFNFRGSMNTICACR